MQPAPELREVREDDLTPEEHEQLVKTATRRQMGELMARNGQLEVEAAQLEQQLILRAALARRMAPPPKPAAAPEPADG